MKTIELHALKKSGDINRQAINWAFTRASAGRTTKELADEIAGYIQWKGGKPAFLGYKGFPDVACISINEEVVHSVPNNRVLCQYDVVTIDVGTSYMGMITDAADTRIIDNDINCPQEYVNLVYGGQKCLDATLSVVKDGVSLWEIAKACDAEAEKHNLTIFPEFTGHGIGKSLHMPPSIFHTTKVGTAEQVIMHRTRLQKGQVICIEPIVKFGPSTTVRTLADQWSAVSMDGRKCVHFENTILVTEQGYEVIS